MFVQRYDYPSSSHRYYWNKPYIQKVYSWGNCTTWCYARSAEAISVHIQKNTTTINQSGYALTTDKPIFATDRDYNACNWYANTLWQKGQIPKVASIVVYDSGNWSSLGHVMFVEQVNSDGTIVVTEGGRTSSGGGVGQYGFKRRTCNPQNACGDCKLLGYIYNPYFDELQPVDKDVTRNQVEVTIDNLRVREHAGLTENIIGICPKGIFNLNGKTKDVDGYTWYELEDNHYIAKMVGVNYYPKGDETSLEKQIKDLTEELAIVNNKIEQIRSILL